MKGPLEAEARLQFNYSACQAGRCLAKCRVIAIDSSRAGGRNGDVCYPLITQRSKIHLVEQVIEICPQLEAGIFTEDRRIRDSEGFSKREVDIAIPRPAERIAVDAWNRRNSRLRKRWRYEIESRSTREIACFLLKLRVREVMAGSAGEPIGAHSTIAAVLNHQVARALYSSVRHNHVEKGRPRKPGMRVPDSAEGPTADHLLQPVSIAEDHGRPRTPQLEIIGDVVVRGAPSILRCKGILVEIKVGRGIVHRTTPGVLRI